MNVVTSCRLPVSNSQCFIGTKKYPDEGVLLNYDDDDYSQAHGQIEQAFRASIKGDILQPYLSDHDFRSSNLGADDFG